MNRILGKVDELAESEEEMNIPFIVGEAVKVIDGPFNGLTGVIEEINEEKKKLKVMVKDFRKKTTIRIEFLASRKRIVIDLINTKKWLKKISGIN